MANELHCNIVESEIEFQLRYYVHFLTNTLGKSMNSFITPNMGLKLSLLFFHKD